jgi:O-antigen/teichoic acid export membrane protein
MRELWGRILQTGGVKIYAVVLGMVSITITARILGPSGRGELVAITTWVTTFSTFAYLSLGQVAVHRAAKSDGEGWLPDAYHTLLTFALVATLAGWAVAGLIYVSPWQDIFGDITPAWLLLGFLLLPFRIWEQYSSSLLMSLERLDVYNRFQFIGSTFGFLLTIFLLVVIGLGVEGVLTSNVLSQLLIAVGGLALLHRSAGGWSRPRWAVMRNYLGSGLKLHMNAIGMFFITGSDILMLNYHRGSEETAFYQLGVQLMGMMMLVPQAAQMVIYGKVSALGADQAWGVHRKILLQVTALVTIGALVAGLTAPWWIVLLVGEAFTASVEVFQWLLLAAVGMTFSTVMAPQWIGRGFFSAVSIMALCFGGLNLILNWFWIPKYGMYGALYATLITYTISVLVNGGMALYCQSRFKNKDEV